MAYRIRMFGRAADPVAHHLCDVLTHAVQARDPAIEEIGERHQGLGWVSLTLASSRGVPILVEVNTRRDVLALSLGGDDARAQGERLDGVNVKIELTLSGEPTDWQMVGAMWSVASEKWSAIPWDEGSGFDIRLDELTL